MDPEGWRRFHRTGSVRAQRLERTLVWHADGGDRLVGRAGDWKVTDGERTWTVADDQFRRSYETDGDTYRRRGVVRARPGRAGEVVETIEGPVCVGQGDWVVEGEEGERWPVPADRFKAAYAAAD